MMNNISKLRTEARNQSSTNIDQLATDEILRVINNEDLLVAQKVQEVIPSIQEAVDAIYASLKNGGRLFYVGAGTSGRIGILDAVECPPTFSTPPHLVQALIAGGMGAIEKAVEGAEDDESQGVKDLQERQLTSEDIVMGIAASGRTPYVIGALKYANEIGANTVSLTSNIGSEISQHANIQIEVETGPEVLTGSTRMKAATAHKIILNMITTTTMIKMGKVYENLMVDVKATNQKLRERAQNILATITSVTKEQAESFLEKSDYQVKPAIIMIETGVDFAEAKEYLQEADGFVREAILLAKDA